MPVVMETPANITNHLLLVLDEAGRGKPLLPARLQKGQAAKTKYKGDYIGEKISQKDHCLQAAHQAAASGADEETVIAALLHDIGQFLPAMEVRELAHDVQSLGGNVGRVGHEVIGAEYLARRGFSAKVAALVGAHVSAKRYLVATDPGYELSEASWSSLRFQGGPMTEAERQDFEADGLWREKCALRKWDDAAKVVGMAVEGLDSYREMIERHLRVRLQGSHSDSIATSTVVQ